MLSEGTWAQAPQRPYYQTEMCVIVAPVTLNNLTLRSNHASKFNETDQNSPFSHQRKLPFTRWMPQSKARPATANKRNLHLDFRQRKGRLKTIQQWKLSQPYWWVYDTKKQQRVSQIAVQLGSKTAKPTV